VLPSANLQEPACCAGRLSITLLSFFHPLIPENAHTCTNTHTHKSTNLAPARPQVSYRYIDLWSRRSTWGGADPPSEGDSVVVPAGERAEAPAARPGCRGAALAVLAILLAPPSQGPCRARLAASGLSEQARRRPSRWLRPAGSRVVLDVSPPALGAVVLEGSLEFDDQAQAEIELRVSCLGRTFLLGCWEWAAGSD
jgi:hypothetical protein